MSQAYQQAGVNIRAGDEAVERIKIHARSTHRPEVIGGLGGFGGLFALNVQKYREPILVSGTDGVGTKLKLAFELDHHETVGIDLVAMCVNDILVSGAEPLYFLDYIACEKLEPEKIENIVGGIAEGCRQAKCALLGGETAEMPGMYAQNEYDLAGFVVGVVEKELIIDPSKVKKNNIIIGIESNGAHSNGYSLINKLIEESKLKNNEKQKLINLALRPTHLYTAVILDLIKKVEIKSIANITGGGLQENIPRSIPNTLSSEIYLDNWKIPAFFSSIQKLGKIQLDDMLRIFNCGIGMTLVIDPRDLDSTINVLSKHKFKGYLIGKVTERSSTKITFV